MALEQRVYSVLIVTPTEKFVEQLLPLLPGASYSPVDRAGSVNEARRKIADRAYDILLINTPLPDENGVRFAMDVTASTCSAVLLFVKTEFYDAIYEKAHSFGVFLLRKPTLPFAISQSLDWLCATRERLRRMEKKSVSLQEKMDEIKLVNRAKWILITHLNMTEDAAHHYIEKQAMDRCVPRRTVAEDILRTYKE